MYCHFRSKTMCLCRDSLLSFYDSIMKDRKHNFIKLFSTLTVVQPCTVSGDWIMMTKFFYQFDVYAWQPCFQVGILTLFSTQITTSDVKRMTDSSTGILQLYSYITSRLWSCFMSHIIIIFYSQYPSDELALAATLAVLIFSQIYFLHISSITVVCKIVVV